MFDDEHQHQHDHAHGDHDHGHVHGNGHAESDAFAEAPLDPANQSLADALRASFRVLKVIMVIVLAVFLGSGAFIVDEKQVVVRSTFGKQHRDVCRPGLHWGWPFPIDQIDRVSTAPRITKVEDFWLRLREEEKARGLDQLGARGTSLNPAVDGALLTADAALWHASFEVQYRIPEANANDFVRNVRDVERLMGSVIKQAAVAEAARTPAKVFWLSPSTLTAGIKTRAQAQFDALETGIQIENVASPDSHYPLQTSLEFLAVNTAENKQRELINEANTERENKLNGIAGRAWQEIQSEIEKFEQVKEESERGAIFKNISKLLVDDAMGEAGGKVQLARRDREGIVNDTLAEVSQFNALREEYKRNPVLVRLRLSQMMRDRLFANKGVVKWVLPPDDKNVVLWLSKDPKETAEETRRRMEEKSKKK